VDIGERVGQIARCVEDVHRCELELRADLTGGAWLGYMDWLEELHRLIHLEDALQESAKEYFGHPEFYRIVDELKELHSEKNRQYATKENPLANFQRTGRMISKFLKPGIDPTLASCLALTSKQIDGIYEIVGECKEGTIDSLEDKLRDVAVYAVIAMIIIRESRK
jgi:hypothetical protein